MFSWFSRSNPSRVGGSDELPAVLPGTKKDGTKNKAEVPPLPNIENIQNAQPDHKVSRPNASSTEPSPTIKAQNVSPKQSRWQTFKDKFKNPSASQYDDGPLTLPPQRSRTSIPAKVPKDNIQGRMDRNLAFAEEMQRKEKPKGFGYDDPFAYGAGPATLKSANAKLDGYNIGGAQIDNRVTISEKAGHPQQDAYSYENSEITVNGTKHKFLLTGVYDGHGPDGHDASDFAKKKAGEYFKKALEEEVKNEGGLTDKAIFQALKKFPVALDKDCTKKEDSGTTATFSVIINDKLWIANVGDSRTFVVNNATADDYKVTQMSQDADTEDPRFVADVEKKGGKIEEKTAPHEVPRLAGLAMTRSIGDAYTKDKGGSAKPKITWIELSKLENAVLVQVSDGVTKKGSTNELGKAVHEMAEKGMTPTGIAQRLAYGAYMKDSRDDITALVIKLPPTGA